VTFEPCPFQLTARLENLLAAIAEAVGKLSAVTLAKPDPKLLRKNRIRTIQASLAIEGNTLTSEQVAALLDKKRVIGPKGPRKNKIPFYPSRLQAIFARSGGGKILKRACYSSGFATTGSNKSNPNPDA
jgi:hypothetical protein